MALLNLEITFPNGFKYPDFDIKTLKKGLRKNGSLVAKERKGWCRRRECRSRVSIRVVKAVFSDDPSSESNPVRVTR